MKIFISCIITLISIGFGCKSVNDKEIEVVFEEETKVEDDFLISPIRHGSFSIKTKNVTIYIDPTGEVKPYSAIKDHDLIIITDIHKDHLDIDALDSISNFKVKIITPPAVAEKLPANYTDQIVLLNNGESKSFQGVTIEAIPMYNMKRETMFHPKGRGNGYVITLEGKRIYISGDTEGVSEMTSLKNIDLAFVCMNMPYTMTIEEAAAAVLSFKPRKVYPYHYKGTDGLSDVVMFKKLLSKESGIEVIQLDWYP